MQQHSLTTREQTNKNIYIYHQLSSLLHAPVSWWSTVSCCICIWKFEDLLHKSSDVILAGLLVCLGFLPDLLCHATFLGTNLLVEGFVLALVNSVKDWERVLRLRSADKMSQHHLFLLFFISFMHLVKNSTAHASTFLALCLQPWWMNGLLYLNKLVTEESVSVFNILTVNGEMTFYPEIFTKIFFFFFKTKRHHEALVVKGIICMN